MVATAREELQATQAKFHVGESPLEKERFLKVLEPRYERQLARMCDLVSAYEKSEGSTARSLAVEMWRMQIAQGSFSDQVKLEFVRRFYRWLIGRGTDADTKRTFWGRGNAAEYNDEVRAYIEMFIDKRAEYARQLTLLANRLPSSLRGYYLYFKYIVDGHLVRKTDATGSYWDMGPEDFLDDFEVFFSEFNNPDNRVLAPGQNDQPPTNPHPGPPYTADFQHGLAAAIAENMANLFNAAKQMPRDRMDTDSEEDVDPAVNVAAMTNDAALKEEREARLNAESANEQSRRDLAQQNERIIAAIEKLQQINERPVADVGAAVRAELERWGPEVIEKVGARIPEREPAAPAAQALGAELAEELRSAQKEVLDRFDALESKTAEQQEIFDASARETSAALNKRVDQLFAAIQEGAIPPEKAKEESNQIAGRLDKMDEHYKALRENFGKLGEAINNRPDNSRLAAQLQALQDKSAQEAQSERMRLFDDAMATFAQLRDMPEVNAKLDEFMKRAANALSADQMRALMRDVSGYRDSLLERATEARIADAVNTTKNRRLEDAQTMAAQLAQESAAAQNERHRLEMESLRQRHEQDKATWNQAWNEARQRVAQAQNEAEAARIARIHAEQAQAEGEKLAKRAQYLRQEREAGEKREARLREQAQRTQAQWHQTQLMLTAEAEEARKEAKYHEKQAEELRETLRKAEAEPILQLEGPPTPEPEFTYAEPSPPPPEPVAPPKSDAPEAPRHTVKEGAGITRRYQKLYNQAVRFGVALPPELRYHSSWRDKPPADIRQKYDEVLRIIKEKDSEHASRGNTARKRADKLASMRQSNNAKKKPREGGE